MVKKPDKGCLPLHIPEPRFLSDPSHRIRILLRPAFLKSNGPVCVERPSKADCLWLKIYYGAWIKKTRNLSLTEFTESSKAPINHLFGCHDYCSESWCPVKSGKSVSNGKYHKEKETKLYKWLMKNLAKKIEGESSFHCIIHWIHRWKISAHDYYSDDDVLAHSNSDSDILATVEKANLSNFWTMIAQRWLVLKAI